MKAKIVEFWKRLSRYTQGIILVMVSILFFGWGIMGAAQVDNQTKRILEGVHDDVHEATGAIVRNQQILLAEGKYITCILTTLPDNRTPKKIHRCLRQSGLQRLQDEETEVLGATTRPRVTPRSLINARRVQHGCRPLKKASPKLIDDARRWSQRMARAGHLFHSELHAGPWKKVGEVLGVGPTWRSIVRALFRSRPHRRILLDCAYDKIAIGVIYRDFVWLTGRLYAV